MSVEDSGPPVRIRVEQFLHEGRVLVECRIAVRDNVPIPGDPVVGQLGGRDERQALVVCLVELARAVEERVAHVAAVAADPREEDQIVVAPGHFERVELKRPEAFDGRHHAHRTGRQRARRSQEMASDEEPPRGRRADRSGGHVRDGTGSNLTPTVMYPVRPDMASCVLEPDPSGHIGQGELGMLAIVGGAVAFILVAGWSALRWLMRGRDPTYLDDASILLPAPPEGMTAATATVIDGGPPGQAFMAGLLDLASRDEIRFRSETLDGRMAVGIEIHGTPTDDARIRLNRRRPVGEGEAWLLAMLKGYAIEGQTGLTDMERGLEAMQSMGGLAGFAAMGLGVTAPDSAASRVDGMSAPAADPQAAILAAFARSGRPVPEHLRESLAGQHTMMSLMAEAVGDPAAISADPAAFAARVQATTGHLMTEKDIAEMQAWAATRQAAITAASAAASAVPSTPAVLTISAARALSFHTPFGFGTFLENYARRKGWIQGLSFIGRWKWRSLAVFEIVLGTAVAAIGQAGGGLIYGVGLGAALGGLATWFIAAFMAARTREGAVMKAQLAAYRRTLKATFGTAATFDDAVGAAGLQWLETPDQALVWGVALGLRTDIEQLLDRTTHGIAAGTLSRDAFLPSWAGPVAPASTSGVTAAAAPGDYAAVFAGIERIGSHQASDVRTWQRP